LEAEMALTRDFKETIINALIVILILQNHYFKKSGMSVYSSEEIAKILV
jgi:hypothetical protein